MVNSHTTDERGVPSNSLAQEIRGFSLPAALDNRPTRTHSNGHTQKVTHGWHNHSGQTHGWSDRAVTNIQPYTHTDHGQRNQCQLDLLSREKMRPQSVIMTLPWRTIWTSLHTQTHRHKQRASRPYQLRQYFMFFCFVSGFVIAFFFWL